MDESMKSQMLKMITHLVLSVSLFSFFFPHSFSWFSFVNSLNYCFSTLPLQLVTHTIDKNCIFVLCNGILVLVVKNSGLISSSKCSPRNQDICHVKPFMSEGKEPFSASKTGHQPNSTKEDFKDVEEKKSVGGQEEKPGVLKGEDEKPAKIEEEKEEGTESNIAEIENEKMVLKGGCITENVSINEKGNVPNKEEEEEEEADGNEEDHDRRVDEENARLSAEELDKKFDEFIRKMKEELRIEARQQLLMVQAA